MLIRSILFFLILIKEFLLDVNGLMSHTGGRAALMGKRQTPVYLRGESTCNRQFSVNNRPLFPSRNYLNVKSLTKSFTYNQFKVSDNWENFAQRTKSSRKIGLRFGSFNARQLGLKKISTTTLLVSLAHLITQYDVLALLEVRDNSKNQLLAETLLEAVQIYCRGKYLDQQLLEVQGVKDSNYIFGPFNEVCDYQYVLSPLLGRANSSYQEQVLVFYRQSRLSLHNSFVLQTTEHEILRPPFGLIFKRSNAFVFMLAVHLSPSKAIQEMDYLARVYQTELRRLKKLNLQSSLLLGDFNADGSYLLNGKLDSRLKLDTDQWWWPQLYAYPRQDDSPLGTTTTETTKHLIYDRIVVPRAFQNTVVPSSASVYRWIDEAEWGRARSRWLLGGGRLFDIDQTDWGISDLKGLHLGRALSDHLPISIELKI